MSFIPQYNSTHRMGQVTLTNDSRKDDESQTWSAFQSSARRIGSSGQKSFDYLDGITWITACYQDLTLALLLVEIIFIYCITTKTSVWLEIKSSCWIAKIISSMFSSLSCSLLCFSHLLVMEVWPPNKLFSCRDQSWAERGGNPRYTDTHSYL